MYEMYGNYDSTENERDKTFDELISDLEKIKQNNNN